MLLLLKINIKGVFIMNNLFVVRKKSKNGDNVYVSLYIDLGYRLLTLSYDIAVISELCNITIRDLNNLDVESPICVGSFNLKG